MYQKSNKDEHK